MDIMSYNIYAIYYLLEDYLSSLASASIEWLIYRQWTWLPSVYCYYYDLSWF